MTAQVSHDAMANAIRFLSVDAVEKAKSGHPGLPMARRTSRPYCSATSSNSTPPTRNGRIATASCCRPATAPCCSIPYFI